MIFSNLALALREIRRNFFRSVLTILGVVIGVAAVIAIVTIGNGATARITNEISGLGANLLIVSPGMQRRGPPRPGGMGGRGRPFTMEDVEAIRESVPGIQAIAPTTARPLFAKTEASQQPVFVTGSSSDYFVVRRLKMEKGRPFRRGDTGDTKTTVIGQDVATQLFGEDNPIGKSIDLDGNAFEVIGVLESTGEGAFGANQDDAMLIPIRTLHDLWSTENEVGALFVKVANSDDVEKVENAMQAVLRQRRGLNDEQRADFQIRGVEQLLSAVRQTTGILTTVIGLIAGISLLVGGIGIMNVMLVTVTERTREIGVRMAIGAQAGDVMLQFLVESSMLTGLGGVVGIAIGLGGGAIATYFIGLPFQPNPLVVFAVFLFSILLGIVFGFLPARRAARLNPIEALHHE